MSVRFPEENEYFRKEVSNSIKSDWLNKSGKKEASPSMKTSNNSTFFDHKIIEEEEEEFSISSDDLM